MADVIMPQMGESIAEGTITKWMKNVGDKIVRDEPLFEISTDKVDAEIPAPASGYLQEIRVPPGTTVPINTVVGIIQEGDAPAATPPAPAPAISLVPPAPEPPPPPPAGPPLPALVPLAETAPPPVSPPAAGVPAPEPMILAPSAAPASTPSATTAITMPSPPPVAPPEPSRPTPPPTASAAPAAPRTAQETVPAPPARVPQAEAAPPPAAAPTPTAPAGEKPRSEMTVDELRRSRSSPVVRNIAAEHNVDITQVSGTGVSGRVTKQDILTHLESRPAPGGPTAAPPTAPAPEQPAPGAPAPPVSPLLPSPGVPAYHPGERVQVIPMSPIRKKTAEHMVLSKRVSAHVSTVFEVDMTRLGHLRHKYRAAYEERSGVKLTYTPFILKAVVDALKAFSVLNSSVDGDAIVYKKDINLGIAVALDWGLIVPVIRNADEKNVLGLARAVSDLADRARTKKLKVEEIQGGTFTVTNPGVFGSLFGTPIINQPQVGILGVGTIEKRPVVRDDAIAIRTMAYLALTFDHRIVDGADADRFMAHLKKGLQEFDESAM